MGDKLDNFAGFIRSKLRKPPQCPQTEDLIFVSEVGNYLRSEEAIRQVRDFWQNAVDADKAEAEKQKSELCLDCESALGRFIGPFGRKYCYDAYTQMPCTRRSDIKDQKQTERRDCWEFFQRGTPTNANPAVLEQVRAELIE